MSRLRVTPFRHTIESSLNIVCGAWPVSRQPCAANGELLKRHVVAVKQAPAAKGS